MRLQVSVRAHFLQLWDIYHFSPEPAPLNAPLSLDINGLIDRLCLIVDDLKE
jgi:hypothetical protein